MDTEGFILFASFLIGLPVTAMLVYPLVRALARRIEGQSSEVKAELEDLRARVADLEAAHDRLIGSNTPLPDKVAALEERVDFTERVLTQKKLTGDR